MTLESGEWSRASLSLESVAERDRAAVFREVVGRQIVKWDLTPGAQPLKAELQWAALPGLEIIWGTVGACEIRRTSEMIADGNDGFSLSIARSGAWRMSSRARELDEGLGRAGLLSLAEPSLTVIPDEARFMVLQVPRAAVSTRLSALDDLVLRPLATNNAPLVLLRAYLEALEAPLPGAPPAMASVVAGHIHDLFALTIEAARGPQAIAGRAELAAAALAAVKAGVLRDLGRQDLCLNSVARANGLNPRQVQRLFEKSGDSFHRFVLASRLAKARDMLADLRHADWKVAMVAIECGFGDVSHFNRTFRRAFEITPTEARRGTCSTPS